MARSTSKKKRGIQRGVAKHKIRSKPLKGRQGERTVFGVGESVYFSIGRKCFEFWLHYCCKLYLVPFTRTSGGEYVHVDRKSTLIHYFVWLLQFLMLLHKLVGLVINGLHEGHTIETFMCTSHFLIYLVSFCISLVMVAKPQETMDVLNSFPFILGCLKQLGKGVPSKFDELSEALKIIAVLLATQGIAVAAALLSLAFSTLPTCYFPAAEYFGLIPEGTLPRFAWQLLFFPLEYATYLPPMLSAPLAGSTVLILVGVHRLVGNEIRRVEITDMEARATVERLYVCQELYNNICYAWIAFILPLIIFSLSLTIIVTGFISIRFTELALHYYFFFANTAISLMIVMFWSAYDFLLITRDSEEVKGQLLSYEAPHLRGMRKAERTRVMKRAKAMRLIETRVGDFADFTISVPLAIWDEIINQVLFLLSF